MYQEFYGLSRMPFQLLPDPDFFYRSQKHDKALTCLEYGAFERAGFIVITGEIGTGKTTLLRYLLRSLDKDLPIALLNQTFLSPEDFLRILCQEFSLPYAGKRKSELIELFGTFLVDQYQQGRYVILILDEAQNLPLDTLEEIRMLSNLDADDERLLQIILVGQPVLREKLQRQELRQFLQRVEVSYNLEPLNLKELREYIHYRLEVAGSEDLDLFDDSAIEAIFDCTGGVPRMINLICHRSLVYGFADSQKKITGDLLETLLKDRMAEGLYPEAKPASSAPNGEKAGNPSDSAMSAGIVDSQTQLTATLNRLTEISNASINAVELAAAKAAKVTSETQLAIMKEQLKEERKLREQLEQRLAHAEDDLSQVMKTLSQKNHLDKHPDFAKAASTSIDQKRQGTPKDARLWSYLMRWLKSLSPKRYTTAVKNMAKAESNLVIQRLVRALGDFRSMSSAKRRRGIIFSVAIITAIFIFSGLTLWQEKEPNIVEQKSKNIDHQQPQNIVEKPPKRESVAIKDNTPVIKNNTPKPDVKPDEISFNLAPPVESVSARTNSAEPIANVKKTGIAAPDFQTGTAAPDLQIDNNHKGNKSSPSPVKIESKILPDRKSTKTSKIRGKKYICVVELANIRSAPTMEAPVVGRIAQGVVVEVIGKKGNWARLIFQGQKSAWIYSGLLRPQ